MTQDNQSQTSAHQQQREDRKYEAKSELPNLLEDALRMTSVFHPEDFVEKDNIYLF